MTRVAILAVLLLAQAIPAAATTASGLRGIVMRGPTQPVCRVGEACSEPAKGVTLAFLRAGRVVGRATTGADGRYRIALRAGTYTVRTKAVSSGIGSFKPGTVSVPTGRVAVRNFTIDTGIR